MGILTPDSKKKLMLELGRDKGLQQQFDEACSHPTNDVDPDTASPQEIEMMKAALRRSLETLANWYAQTQHVSEVLADYMRPLSERIRRNGNLYNLAQGIESRIAEQVKLEMVLGSTLDMLETDFPA